MAILQHETIESSTGFKKEIEESALTMIFDNLQKSQYRYPIKSTVRELACNALDAVKERNAVLEILEGRKKEEDYFIRRDDAIYKDSNFNKDYYDPKWWSDEQFITITYHSVPTTEGTDYISIKDDGVGLGGKRLEGYMKLGYSTKRNSKMNIGKYGIGAKAPLSTNVASYRLITTYNGKRFMFDIYSHKVDSAIPKLNMKTGKQNKGYKFANGFMAYYEETTDKNSTEIIVQTKKHHKQQYIEAVKSQLLYLQGIKFYVNENGYLDEQTVTSDVLYEDDKIILADNHQYSKPHIVIDGVSYGYIDFLELELENKVGNVGIKVAPEEVDVNPSREYVIWNEKTRETVVNRFNEVVDIASGFVEAELDEKDFVKWVTKCTATLAYTDRNSTLGRLSQLINKSDIKPAFPGDKTVKYKPLEKFFRGFKVRTITKKYDNKKGEQRVQRVLATSWSDVNFKNVYLQEENTSHHKDLFLYQTISDGKYNEYVLILEPIDLPEDTTLNKKQQDDYIIYQEKIIGLLESSNVPSYDDLVIPEDWTAKIDKMVKAEEDGDPYSGPVLTPAERRKINEATVYKVPEYESEWYGSGMKLVTREWTLKAVTTIDDNPNISQLIYATSEDRPLVQFIFKYLKKTQKNSVMLISISKQNVKLYRDLKKSIYIKDMFKQINIKEKSIAVNSLLKSYNTARIIGKELDKLNFLKNFSAIDVEVWEKFKEVRTYQKHNFYNGTGQIATEINDFLDKLVEFQLFVKEVDGQKKLVSDKSQELFGTPDFDNSVVIDMDIFEKYKELLSYAEPISPLLNEVDALTNVDKSISEELEREVKNYIAYKTDTK